MLKISVSLRDGRLRIVGPHSVIGLNEGVYNAKIEILDAQIEFENRICANERCAKSFKVRVNNSIKKFCSFSCRDNTARRRAYKRKKQNVK